uniref:Uncharacterized protein n=1 Tax=Anguilla anguilla TaxID=7936 RepID=A0A0E9RD16_ANGAN
MVMFLEVKEVSGCSSGLMGPAIVPSLCPGLRGWPFLVGGPSRAFKCTHT